jgi:hypothetical protein
MPIKLSSGDRKILIAAGAVFAVLVLVSLLFVSSEGNRETVPTTYSTDSNGAKAAFLLLQQSGYRVKRWEQKPSEIKTAENVTLILAEPSTFADKEDRAAIRRFIEKGGHLIAIGEAAAQMLPRHDVQLILNEEMVWEKYPATAPSSEARAAPEITMAPRLHWSSPASAFAVYGKYNRTVVVRYLYGKGKVTWWAAPTPLTNAGIREPGNLEFFIACLGDKSKTRILWDEYFHGYAPSEKPLYDARLVRILLVHFGLLCAAVLLTYARRSGPIRPSSPEIRLSPLEFVESLGGLDEHARASAVAVDIHYQRFLYWMTRRLGLSRNAPIVELEQAARNRWNFQDKALGTVLQECSSARLLPNLPAGKALKLVRSLHSYAVQLKLFPASAKESNKWKQSRNY